MLKIKTNLVDTMLQHAQQEHPIECCGVLVGPEGSDQAERCIKMQNVAASETFFKFDTKQQLQIWREMEENNEEPIVIYHSHTNSIAYPSSTDIQYANEPFSHFIIIPTNPDYGNTIRSFRIFEGRVTEENITIVEQY